MIKYEHIFVYIFIFLWRFLLKYTFLSTTALFNEDLYEEVINLCFLINLGFEQGLRVKGRKHRKVTVKTQTKAVFEQTKYLN